ncbi:MAG: DUF624 domain-containing protein [Ruminococcaceae bacterium]|nr:DUF624 domain-containing protein [Oscillospiraceae bacterium]
MKKNPEKDKNSLVYKMAKNALILRIGEILSDSLFVLVKWNFYFFITCLPVVTIGPAMAALSHCTNMLAKDDYVVYGATKNYFAFFKQSFRKTFGMGLVFLAVNTVLVSGLVTYAKMMEQSVVFIPLVSVSLFGLAAVWALAMHIFPEIWEGETITEKPLVQLVKQAAVSVLQNMKRTVIAVLVNAFVLLLTAAYFPATLPVVFTVSFAVPAMVAAFSHTLPESFY